MRRPALFIAALSLSLALAATAGATMIKPNAPDNAVSFAHLDLANAYDADAALTRIQGAARRSCGFDLRPHPLAERLTAAHCVNATVASSVRALDYPMLSQRYALHGDTVLVAAH